MVDGSRGANKASLSKSFLVASRQQRIEPCIKQGFFLVHWFHPRCLTGSDTRVLPGKKSQLGYEKDSPLFCHKSP
jgi:hypothetical protein